ncbi:hypothetical protein HNO13_15450 [Bacillus velezensis]|uniref:hypothetical protein n=1 Tax=Bacillus amyloliquefaciens group TaxID=1938374 RepID=UPI0009F36BD7|nr:MULTISPECIES: hypothetical protein [Bacillus amyloliquefaciens group]MBW8603118.1 hypothetical protein [Bacillus amyloliquefaciens]MEE3674327.1 hypothetical protein [Bacillus velezensis]OQV40036.1 hypothetical protein B5M57_14030 [Bacillus velezensis]QBK81049.1 hypothetical protein EYS44_15575 [Bacillus velezensis]QJW64173.1 hypothetical protein HNO12_15440 [Bacillus amyloliquefaciens]
MNLETNIKDVIAKQMEEGIVEKIVAEQLEKGISKALEHLFSSYGDVTEVIKSKLKSVIVPYLENYDYSKYITKLDHVLVGVLQNTTLENRNLLNNFKGLMSGETEKTIKLSDLFAKWKNYVAKNVETDELEVEFDDGPEYEEVEVSVNVERNEDRSWSSFEHATILFECDHDEEMNFEIPISFYKNGTDKEWDLRYNSVHDLKSLRHLNEFEILLMKLSQNGVGIILDIEWENDSVTPEEEPEPSF